MSGQIRTRGSLNILSLTASATFVNPVGTRVNGARTEGRKDKGAFVCCNKEKKGLESKLGLWLWLRSGLWLG